MDSSARTTKIWKLEKYARFLNTPSKGKARQGDQNPPQQNWKLYEGQDLTLAVTSSNNLLITYRKEIQENHTLWNAQSWIKGVCKGDSMLIIYKIQDQTRRFRIKFSSCDGATAKDQCADCQTILSGYFSFKQLAADPEQEAEKSHPSALKVPERLEGQVPIQKLGEVFSGALKASLPSAYRSTNIPTEELGTFVRLCLSDSNFPAFVGQVEQELAKVRRESTSS